MKSAIASVDELMAKEFANFDDLLNAMRDFASESAGNCEQLRVYLEGQPEAPEGKVAIKVAMMAKLFEQYDRMVKALKNASEGKEKQWLLGAGYKGKRDYAGAIAAVEKAKSKGWDEVLAVAELVELNRLAGKLDVAAKLLGELKAKAGDSVYYEYQAGELAEANGDAEGALDHLQKAVEKGTGYQPALFRYAFLLDMNGEEDKAVPLYIECLKVNPVYVNALINLSVLYEDVGKYELSKELLDRVAAVYPNHPRAKLFLKDVDSSLNMFYDEEYERKRDKFQQVLDMPISDFELSVRSRNCLKKMGIRTLGDLTRITEAELLSYKNFGETSLNEIKAILTSKGLRLGQAVEDKASKKAAAILPGGEEVKSVADQAMLSKLIDDLQFSVRSRKCLQRLNVNTVGELISYSESELMSVKNFGSISLKEVKEKLTEMGMSLRESEK
jgi:DNA-directed RNA polymerase subunit alpha